MLKTHLFRLLTLALLALAPWLRADDSAMRSPVNQVFQFMYTGECKNWPDGATTQSTAYLWVPENCAKLRGVIVMCPNVPEHMLVGHSAIRKTCEDNNLGLVFCAPTFWRFGKTATGSPVPKGPEIDKIEADFFQHLLDGLAAQSGYTELSTVPWIPMGESGHLLMVQGLVGTYPERCIAVICMKNPGGELQRKRERLKPPFLCYGPWARDMNGTKCNPTSGRTGMPEARSATIPRLGPNT